MSSRRPHPPLSVALVGRDPVQAGRAAERLLAERPGPADRAVALRVLGMARDEMGDPGAAHRLLRSSAALAARAGRHDLAALARASRQGLLARHARGPGPGAPPADRDPRGLSAMNLGVAAAQRGWFGSAAAWFGTARRSLGSDDPLLPGLLSNLGLALLYAGRFGAAEERLAAALDLSERHGLRLLRGVVVQNLGCLAVRRGDIGTAMERFDGAAAVLPAHRLAGVQLDRAEGMVAAGLGRDAAALIRAAALGRADHRPDFDADRAAALLLRAKVHLAGGEHGAALALARRVRARFGAASAWSRIARQVEWSARVAPAEAGQRGGAAGRAAGGRPHPGVPQHRAAHPRSHGRPPDPDAVVHLPGWARGLPPTSGTARALAPRVAAAPLGPPRLARPGPGHTGVLDALARGDHRRAWALLCGLPAASSAHHLELRAHAGAAERALLALGARTALRNGDPEGALEWVEYRAAPAVPGGCRDPLWAGALDRARAAERGSGAAATLPMGLAQWHRGCAATPAAPAAVPGGPVAAELRAALGRRVYARFVRLHGLDVLLTMVDGRVAAHRVPAGRGPASAVAKLAHTARVQAGAPGGELAPVLREQARRVEALLLGPIRGAAAGRPLVLALSPGLLGVPWGLLPGLAGREVAVAPSARSWLGCAGSARRAGGAALLVGDDALPGVRAELAALRGLYPGARVLAGPAATAPAVLAALADPAIGTAHIAAHGAFTAAAPLASALSLSGGPLFGYDLERLPRVPPVTVLSACWMGRSDAAPSGVPLGMAAAMLALGGATVVAGVLPVRDNSMAAAMRRAHADLCRGAGPARVVADHLADAGFVCFGAG
ncbi:CHAT domain-containing protein [Murinocardiopsis flavida]|uniref:CHAT domain-containing protein n=1 Tax=Murinocardiopsis flavida TaxID=645275 RepID=A0A2P8DTV7_9ACTN|nr:CHAT domain-containing protein [Murinocardiopsis flavida]PSL00656.1 CHAT domain-containing protein [Murinocardiopsis flavida]